MTTLVCKLVWVVLLDLRCRSTLRKEAVVASYVRTLLTFMVVPTVECS